MYTIRATVATTQVELSAPTLGQLIDQSIRFFETCDEHTITWRKGVAYLLVSIHGETILDTPIQKS